MSATLITHCGGSNVTEEEVRSIVAPQPDGRWMPVSHSDFLDEVHGALAGFGLTVAKSTHALAKDGLRYFGTFDVKGGDDYGMVVGVRNGNDRAFAAGVCFGSRVFVCDNLAFSGEVVIAKSHTINIMRVLPRAVRDAVGRYRDFSASQDKLFQQLKQVLPDGRPAYLLEGRTDQIPNLGEMERPDLDNINRSVDPILMEMYRAGAIPSSQIGRVLDEWENPSFEAFKPRTAWSLFNAATTVIGARIGKTNPPEAADRTIRLTSLFARKFVPSVVLN